MKHITLLEIINGSKQLNESSISDKLQVEFNKVIAKIDDSLSYKDLATTIANIIKDDYGTHNYAPFIKELQKQLNN